MPKPAPPEMLRLEGAFIGFICGVLLGCLVMMTVYDDGIERTGTVISRGHLYRTELVR